MSWTNINNEESGSSIRTKLNNAMNALFGFLPITEFWEAVTGVDRIKPTDGNGVETPELVVGDDKVKADNDGLHLRYLGFTPGLFSQKTLVIDQDGLISGVNYMVRNLVIVDANHSLAINNGVVMVFLVAANVQVNLPVAANAANAEAVIRLNNEVGSYHLTVDASSSNNLWYNDNINEIQSKQIRTSTKGSWLRVKSNGSNWLVIENGGTWTYVV